MATRLESLLSGGSHLDPPPLSLVEFTGIQIEFA